MTYALLRVVRAGPLVSIQDAGRNGKLRFGVTASGPMDRLSFETAHSALGLPLNRPAIEVSLGGVSLTCEQGSVNFSVVGGGFRIEIDGQVQPHPSVLQVRSGQTITVAPGSTGSWCYLAFAGALKTKKWLGSAATNTNANLGGGTLKAGQYLTITNVTKQSASLGEFSPYNQVDDQKPFRIVPGPQLEHFASTALDTLTANPYCFTSSYDRMGVKLSGPKLTLRDALSIPSAPISKGSLQVAGDGLPTILLADHQTCGGYPKVATLISADIDRLVQQRMPQEIRFEAITPSEAIDFAREYKSRKSAYLRRRKAASPSAMTRLIRENSTS